jgi:hypothetical protein
MNSPRPKTPQEYAQDLERVLAQCLQPLKNIPFKAAIRAVANCAVLDFDSGNAAHADLADKIKTAAVAAGKEVYAKGIFTARPNEAGNEIEPFVKVALLAEGLQAKTPVTMSGKAKAAGYPDVEVTGNIPFYLECKTYNLKNVETTQRAFYFSPSEQFKVTRDALHLLLAFQLEKTTREGKAAFVPVHWKLITLQDLMVDLKHEFNQHNRNMYGSGASNALIAEADIK